MNIVLPEIVAVGIYNSQIAVKNKTITPNRKTTMFEIEIPIEDGGTSFINNEQMPIRKNTIICAKPGQVRHSKLPFKCYYIHIILKEGALYEALMDTPNFIKTSHPDIYTEIYKRMCKYYDTNLEKYEIILQSLILELIHQLIDNSEKVRQREKVKSNNYRVIEEVITFIKENPTAELSLEKLANHAGFSPIYFHNCFKASTGKTLHTYIEEIRIKKAIKLLLETDFSLTRISQECGFSSQSYFSFVFKRKMRLTPRAYAKKIFERYDNNRPAE